MMLTVHILLIVLILIFTVCTLGESDKERSNKFAAVLIALLLSLTALILFT